MLLLLENPEHSSLTDLTLVDGTLWFCPPPAPPATIAGIVAAQCAHRAEPAPPLPENSCPQLCSDCTHLVVDFPAAWDVAAVCVLLPQMGGGGPEPLQLLTVGARAVGAAELAPAATPAYRAQRGAYRRSNRQGVFMWGLHQCNVCMVISLCLRV